MKNNFLKAITILMALSMVACSSSGGKTEQTSEKTEETAQETVKEPAKEETAAFEPFTAIENDECAVIVKDIKEGGLTDCTVRLALENKSSDKTYMYAAEAVCVNNIQVSSLFATTVAPGKKSNDDLIISDAALKENGIKKFSDIEVFMRIYDSEDWSADPVAQESFHIYPYGEENVEHFTRSDSPDDIVLADTDDVKIIVTGYDSKSVFGYTVKLYLENKTDRDVMFAVENASVNGYMADPFFATSLKAGRCQFANVTWMDSVLKENDIENVETIEFGLRAYDMNDFMNNYVEETFTLNP